MATFKPIDLSGLIDERKASSIKAQIAEACEKKSYFQVINHGVPIEIMEELREVGHKFFDLSKEEKLAVAGKPYIGAEGYGNSMILTEPKFWREFLEVRILPLSERRYKYWPQQPAEFRETVEKYSAAVLDLTHRLLAVMSENLGLKPTYLRNAMGHTETQQNIVFQCYPPCPEPENNFGLHAHSDIGGISILMQQGEGLQVAAEDGTWELVPPYPNALVVNLADQIEIITNGRYKSAQHRAIVNRQGTRRSYVTFYHPAMDQKMFPAPQLVDAKVGPLYREFFYKEYWHALPAKRVIEKRLIHSFAINNSVSS
ncbi:hypothetical protein O6H91_04G002300 [Diphasiastrum complanatum]|uniref:Uncharacterized protein n=2 Tax=Diphasiastrum complanatum TaxID=34168 RepID=A0ACC2DTJ2_DIPCM|nr:hypothetical protein O6H91_04G002000 [Diphasiastrum complanatum]KAJ7557623.1 hypothetical protein O6H91_04G002300 [Diphasiastrum complanatum]